MSLPVLDGRQVQLNGGPPCFALLGDSYRMYARFCGRAKRWHSAGTHPFVPTYDGDFLEIELEMSTQNLAAIPAILHQRPPAVASTEGKDFVDGMHTGDG